MSKLHSRPPLANDATPSPFAGAVITISRCKKPLLMTCAVIRSHSELSGNCFSLCPNMLSEKPFEEGKTSATHGHESLLLSSILRLDHWSRCTGL